MSPRLRLPTPTAFERAAADRQWQRGRGGDGGAHAQSSRPTQKEGMKSQFNHRLSATSVSSFLCSTRPSCSHRHYVKQSHEVSAPRQQQQRRRRRLPSRRRHHRHEDVSRLSLLAPSAPPTAAAPPPGRTLVDTPRPPSQLRWPRPLKCNNRASGLDGEARSVKFRPLEVTEVCEGRDGSDVRHIQG